MTCSTCKGKGVVKEESGATFMCKECTNLKYIKELAEKIETSKQRKQELQYFFEHSNNETEKTRNMMEQDAVNDRLKDLEMLLERFMGKTK